MATRGYALAFALGAVAGGAALAWGTRAAPGMMAEMMQRMMAHMKEAGCSPEEM